MTSTRILAALAAGLVLAGAGTAAALADDSAQTAPTVAAVANLSTSTPTTAPGAVPATVADDGGRTAVQYGRDNRASGGRHGVDHGVDHGGDHGVGHVRHGDDDGPGHDFGDDRGGDR
jgi:hypothetical protein